MTKTRVVDQDTDLTAAAVSFAPNGSIAATDVQAAIQEVRDEAGGSGAPSTADYLVGTADGGLSAEIVVGTTPGGELGGTWGAPTVDAIHSGSAHDLVFKAANADTAINSVTDVTIVTTDIAGLAAGDQLLVDAVFTIHNNSTATRIYNVSLDFDGQFPAEMITLGLSTHATSRHPFRVRGVLDIRSNALAYAVTEIEANSASSQADDANITMSTTMTQGKAWGTVAADLTGTVTVALLIKSANATATQTLFLHHFTVRRIRA